MTKTYAWGAEIPLEALAEVVGPDRAVYVKYVLAQYAPQIQDTFETDMRRQILDATVLFYWLATTMGAPVVFLRSVWSGDMPRLMALDVQGKTLIWTMEPGGPGRYRLGYLPSWGELRRETGLDPNEIDYSGAIPLAQLQRALPDVPSVLLIDLLARFSGFDTDFNQTVETVTRYVGRRYQVAFPDDYSEYQAVFFDTAIPGVELIHGADRWVLQSLEAWAETNLDEDDPYWGTPDYDEDRYDVDDDEEE